MVRRTKIVVLMLMLIVSIIGNARRLTTTNIRENSIRINALEIETLNIDKVKEKVVTPPKKVTIVLDAQALNFDFDKSNVKPEYYDKLRNVIKYVEFYNYNMEIVGHTDSQGSDQYNMELGQRRADSVKAKLIELGLNPARILGTSSMGESEPVATNDTKEGRFQNRRIEFKLELIEDELNK